MPPETKRALGLLYFTVFLDLLGFGLILPQLPYYAKACGAGGTAIGAIGASYSLLQFLFSPVWGSVSDRVGRRPVILIGLAGSGVSFIVFGAAFRIHEWTGLGLIPILFLSRAIAGLFNANIATAQAYVADLLPPDRRAGGMGMLGAAFGLGFILGPAISAFIGEVTGPTGPFYVAGAVCLMASVAAYFVLPESHPAGEPTEAARRGWLSLARLPRGELLAIVILFFTSTFAMGVMENTLGLLVQEEPRLAFSSRDFAWLLCFTGVVIVFAQGGFLPRLARRFGEVKLIRAGAIMMMIGLGPLGAAPDALSVYVLMLLVGFGNGLLNPSLATRATILSPDGARGETMGVAQAMSALGRIAGPVAGGVVFEHVSHVAAYAMAGAMMALSLGIALAALRQR